MTKHIVIIMLWRGNSVAVHSVEFATKEQALQVFNAIRDNFEALPASGRPGYMVHCTSTPG